MTAGETVILGTNGGQMESANDLVFAIPQADDSLLGDVDKDSAITARELTHTKRIVLANSHSACLIMLYSFILWLK